MDSKKLKEAIAFDLNSLKKMELEIMPANLYYRKCFKLFISIILKLSVASVASALLSFVLWQPHLGDVVDTLIFLVIGPIAVPLAFSILFLPLNSNYIIFKYQLREKLKTGDFIMHRIERTANISYRIFVVLIFLSGLLWGPYPIWAVEFTSFLIGALLIVFLADMEIKRIGLSALFELLNKYFSKEQSLFNK